MKKTLILIFVLGSSLNLFAQKYLTKTGHISFFSKTSIENIEAHNQQASCVIDFASGEMVFQVLMKGFEFKKALMQEHFNENYVESVKFPKANFKGKIKNLSAVALTKEGVYNVEVEGSLTLHGVTKPANAKGTIEVKAGKIHAKSKFNVKPKDYNIKIPNAVRDNIAETIEVTIDALCAPFSK